VTFSNDTIKPFSHFNIQKTTRQQNMITKEEQRIDELGGRNNPFRVPEGYFEQFDARLMARLPRTEKKAKEVRLMPRLWRYAAAVLIIVGVGSAIVWNRQSSAPIAYNEDVEMEEYYNEALDYAMVDNMEIAAYLTEAE